MLTFLYLSKLLLTYLKSYSKYMHTINSKMKFTIIPMKSKNRIHLIY